MRHVPKYSYRCTSCEHAFDIQQSFTDDALTVCDRCGGALRKVFGAVGIAFKGSGFYRTDHGAGAKPKPESASGASTAGEGGTPAPTTSTTSDSKPASTGTASSGAAAAPAGSTT